MTPGGGHADDDRPLRAIYIRYMTLRIVLFVATLAVFVLLDVGGVVLEFFLSLVVSGLLAYPLAIRQRQAVVRAIERRRQR
ncbi:MAG: hypothetical protein ACQSGP_18955 [Frankia sp.]